MSESLTDLIVTTRRRLLGKLYRIVESQEEVATRGLVDSLQKQQVLESLLERSKPARLPGSEGLHYLLATPFRYPPLPWGSRFGRVSENGIFYGSKSLTTVLAEAAFYRLRFYSDMAEPPTRPITTYHNIFSAKYRIHQGVALQNAGWRPHWQKLSDPVDYRFTQQLGTKLRGLGIEGIESISARAIQTGLISLPTKGDIESTEGINVALFEPSCLLKRPPAQEADVTAETGRDGVTFLIKSAERVGTHEFQSASFAVEGRLPEPA